MVAFQHIYSDLIQSLKQDLAAGRAGRLLSISAHGLWPRPTRYYERSGWAGQLEWHGEPVLDGPCTNAFAHFVNLVLYLAAGEAGAFATPSHLAGELYRARPDLSAYDAGSLTGSFDTGIRFFIGFSHASSNLSPVAIHIHGDKEMLSLDKDCETLRWDQSMPIQGNDGRENLRRAFLAFANGDRLQNKTPLEAIRAYVLSTNLMFLSSGGIHTIPAGFVRPIKQGTKDAIFEIENIGSIFQQCATGLVPFSQIPVPWAKKTPLLESSRFSEDELRRTLRLSARGTQASTTLVTR